MAVLTRSDTPSPLTREALTTALPVVLGLAALLLPTWWSLQEGPWNTPDQAHGPLVLMIVLWLFWRARAVFTDAHPQPALGLGGAALALGLALYVVGRSQGVPIFEVAAELPIVAALILLFQGLPALRQLHFPMLFMAFLVPLPGFLLDALTGPLKQLASVVVEQLLYHVGYPIARSGVMLTIGQYQLQVADACSGLQSMYALTAMGLLYIHLSRPGSRLLIALLVALIIPIAFVANLVRIVFLVLLTYYKGDEAGQGFMHDFAGVTVFVVALLLFIAADWVLRRIPGLARRPA